MSDSGSKRSGKSKGLSRKPPAHVRAALAREVGYGCPVRDCGNPYLEWHHFDPEWHVRHHHNPEGMIALCHDHHARAGGGAFTLDQVRALKREGRANAAAIGGSFDWLRDELLVVAGGCTFQNTPNILWARGSQVVWVTRNEDGLLRLNLNMPGGRFQMRDNFWTDLSGAEAVTCPPSGRTLKVVYPNKDLLSVEFRQVTDLAEWQQRHGTAGLPDRLIFSVTTVEVGLRVKSWGLELLPGKPSTIDGTKFFNGVVSGFEGPALHVDEQGATWAGGAESSTGSDYYARVTFAVSKRGLSSATAAREGDGPHLDGARAPATAPAQERCLFCGEHGPHPEVGVLDNRWHQLLGNEIVDRHDGGWSFDPLLDYGRHTRSGAAGVSPVRVTRNVCRACQEGWRARLEDAVEPTLGAMALGGQLDLSARAVRTISRWAAVAAYIVESLDDNMQVSYEHARRLLCDEDDQPPVGLSLWLHSVEPNRSSYLRSRISAYGDGAAQEWHPWRITTMQLGQVALTTIHPGTPTAADLLYRAKPERFLGNMPWNMADGWHYPPGPALSTDVVVTRHKAFSDWLLAETRLQHRLDVDRERRGMRDGVVYTREPAIRMLDGNIVVIRHDGVYAAVKPLAQTGAEEGASIRYRWWYQSDGSTILSGGDLGEGYGETGEQYPGTDPVLTVGPMQLKWSVCDAGSGWLYHSSANGSGNIYDLALSDCPSISDLGDAAQLEFYRYEP